MHLDVSAAVTTTACNLSDFGHCQRPITVTLGVGFVELDLHSDQSGLCSIIKGSYSARINYFCIVPFYCYTIINRSASYTA